MQRVITFAVVVALLMGAANVKAQFGPKPPDTPCITWQPLTVNEMTPPPSQVISRPAYIVSGCQEKGYIMGCWATDAGTLTWGHHDYAGPDSWDPVLSDYCRAYVIDKTYPDGMVLYSNTMYIPTIGAKAQSLEWVTVNTGDAVPYNVVQFNDRILATSLTTPPGHCSGVNFTGWAEKRPDGSFGYVHFSIVEVAVTTTTFQVAICHDLTSTTTTATPTPPPTPAPTLPNNKPYIRFANVVPSKLADFTATLAQGSISHTWNCYSFPMFSEWDIRTFQVGPATLTVNSCKGGTQLLKQSITLTFGPLLIALTGGYPLNNNTVETIAASYVPRPRGKSGVRLVNLAPDVKSAGLRGNGLVLQDGVPYPNTAAHWANISDSEAIALSVFNDKDNTVLAKATVNPPHAPLVFSAYLVGLANATTGSPFVPQLLALVDAPES